MPIAVEMHGPCADRDRVTRRCGRERRQIKLGPLARHRAPQIHDAPHTFFEQTPEGRGLGRIKRHFDISFAWRHDGTFRDRHRKRDRDSMGLSDISHVQFKFDLARFKLGARRIE